MLLCMTVESVIHQRDLHTFLLKKFFQAASSHSTEIPIARVHDIEQAAVKTCF